MLVSKIRGCLYAMGFLTLVLAAGCGNESPTGFSPFKAANGEAWGARLVFAHLQNSIRPGFHYEAWAVIDRGYVSLGKFRVDGDGNVVDLQGNRTLRLAAPRDISKADQMVITLEPQGDENPASSGIIVLQGDVTGGVADLRMPFPPGLLSGAQGRFVPATYSDNNLALNELNGVWFTDPSVGPGLTLPPLPAEWIYEGWVQTGQGYISTGKFRDPVGPDRFHGHSLRGATPPFPGEDFLINPPSHVTFPLDLRGAAVFITLEPMPDDHLDFPAQFVLLRAIVPHSAVPHMTITMTNLSDGLPTGRAVLY